MLDHPWTECFDFYFSEWRQAPLVLQVDLGACDVAPLRTHPVRLQARVPMARARADGLRDAAEATQLFALEDALCRELGGVAPLLFVGRVVGLGEVTFVWYAPQVVDRLLDRLEQAARTAAARAVEGAAKTSDPTSPADPYAVFLSKSEDPEWTFYFDFLYPDVYNLQVMLNRRRVLTLVDHGDDGARPRLVEHHVRFGSARAAQASAEVLRRAGFDVVGDGAAPAPPPTPPASSDAGGSGRAPGSLDLWVSREDALADGRIDDVCVEILDAILPQQGDYQGWASPILCS